MRRVKEKLGHFLGHHDQEKPGASQNGVSNPGFGVKQG